MAKTYEPIASQTLTNNTTSTVTFSNIPQTYTDIRIVSRMWTEGTNQNFCYINLGSNQYLHDYGLGYVLFPNNVSYGQSYSSTYFSPNIYLSQYLTSMTIFDIFNYSSSSRRKSVSSLSQTLLNNDFRFSFLTGIFRSTAQVTTINIYSAGSAKFGTGSSFTLYGIKGL